MIKEHFIYNSITCQWVHSTKKKKKKSGKNHVNFTERSMLLTELYVVRKFSYYILTKS